MKILEKKPDWLRKKIFFSQENHNVNQLLNEHKLNTVCAEARCPNRSECFHKKTATFLILGRICTRHCLFCSVETQSKFELPLDEQEPFRVADLVKKLQLNYAVITSVTRDDLLDGGANHFAKTVTAIRKLSPNVKIEVLTPDFQGCEKALSTVIFSKPDVYNHNIETVERISRVIRNKASYKRSLAVLEKLKQLDKNCISKSGIMLGFGETEKEVRKLIEDLKNVACDILTIGQYLQPTKGHYPVQEYVQEEQFKIYETMALELGIPVVHAGPFVRSSYKAEESYNNLILNNDRGKHD